MIRTAFLALVLALSATAAHAAQPNSNDIAVVEQDQRACDPIFITCPNPADTLRGVSVLNKDFAPAPLRDSRETVIA
ncbi:hypothetical protein [Devosia sp. FKR38]|uniref:hypothetical protein n=1 Tax=Devosia sp. FKR38 TaxID=2562312 RepID=UPI0010C01E84|nr:hypothetical protein [Devosia sp. FKR38]